jgi:cytochrome oxidase Cu insertion factor (SCO1/SenC/PrrC family)
LLLAAVVVAQAQQSQRREGDLKEGGTAPDFTIKDVAGKKTVTLSDLKGKPVVLLFGSCT